MNHATNCWVIQEVNIYVKYVNVELDIKQDCFIQVVPLTNGQLVKFL